MQPRIQKLERNLAERYPGPDNDEPWAGKRKSGHKNYDHNYVPAHMRKKNDAVWRPIGGGGNSRQRIQPLHIELNRIFDDEIDSYFKIIDKFGVYFRVCGKMRQFGTEGPDNIEFLKADKILGIDFVIPEAIWKNYTDYDLRCYFADSIRTCFGLLLVESEERGFLLKGDKLVADFNKKIEIFMN